MATPLDQTGPHREGERSVRTVPGHPGPTPGDADRIEGAEHRCARAPSGPLVLARPTVEQARPGGVVGDRDCRRVDTCRRDGKRLRPEPGLPPLCVDPLAHWVGAERIPQVFQTVIGAVRLPDGLPQGVLHAAVALRHPVAHRAAGVGARAPHGGQQDHRQWYLTQPLPVAMRRTTHRIDDRVHLHRTQPVEQQWYVVETFCGESRCAQLFLQRAFGWKLSIDYHYDVNWPRKSAKLPSKTKLLDHMRLVLRLKHISLRTEEAYVQWVRRFILLHHKRHP